MNFKRVLHPEIVLDRRGEPLYREIYRRVSTQVKRCSEWKEDTQDGRTVGGYEYVGPAEFLTVDEFARQHFIMMKRWRGESNRVYHIEEDFLLALAKVDRDLPVELLPDKFFAYLSFPKDKIFDGEHWVEGAYVAIDTPKNLGFGINGVGPDAKVIWISYITYPELTLGNLLVEPKQEKMSKLLDEMRTCDYRYGSKETASKELQSKRNAIYRAAINALLYIHSLDPELHKLAPIGSLTKSQLKRARETGSVTDCTVPVTLVNHRYKKGVQYSVDHTWVDTFLRIQRCGPGLTQYKFVWVREHERRFNKE
jgi:hypothetical protein